MSVIVGDVVRTAAGHYRVVTHVDRSGRSTTYSLTPLPGSPGRRSYAERVTFVRSFELTACLRILTRAGRQVNHTPRDVLERDLEHARRYLKAARLAARDGAGELDAAAVHLAHVAAMARDVAA